MLRIEDRLSDDLEDLIHRTIGYCIEIHRGVGPGLRERVYTRALVLELKAQNVSFEQEKRFPVVYRDQLLGHQSIDFIIEGKLALELKSVEQLAAVHRSQVLRYLRRSQLKAGLLVNFNVAVLPDGGLKRVVLSRE